MSTIEERKNKFLLDSAVHERMLFNISSDAAFNKVAKKIRAETDRLVAEQRALQALGCKFPGLFSVLDIASGSRLQ